MPYNPIKQFPRIVSVLREEGYGKKRIPLPVVQRAVMRVLGVTRDRKIGKYIQLLEDFGYLEYTKNQTWRIADKQKSLEETATASATT